MAFSNDNMVIKSEDGKVKFQCTCYRLFLVFAVGHTSITSVLLQKARKFGFFIALMTPGFRICSLLGAVKDGNTLLHKKQYSYSGMDIAKHIIINKIHNQISELKSVRNKSDYLKESINAISEYITQIPECDSVHEIMAYEGLSSKLYFKSFFNNTVWNGRQPRLKHDYVNSTLDIGYTLLFSLIDTLLSCFGFDTYCGVLHTQFYMRKSLVCDLVEPFRPIVDRTVKKGINLRQIQEDDFTLVNGQFRLKWSETSKYVKLLMEPLIEEKNEIFSYIQAYYRAFMKGLPVNEFPVFYIGE